MPESSLAVAIGPDGAGASQTTLDRLRAEVDRQATRRVPVSARPAPGGRAAILGRTEPRLWTPPLRPLNRRTSFGYAVVEFAADELRRPLDPWQRWLMIHAGELLPDGRPRYRTVLVLVARQNGKTDLLVTLTSFWQFVARVPLILGTSNKLAYAQEAWAKSVRRVESAPNLRRLLPPRKWTRRTNGEYDSWTAEGAHYKVAAANGDAGRGQTVDRLVMDELRQQHTYEAYDAAVPAGNAVDDFQAWLLSNAGSDNSIVLNDLRESALEYITTGRGDERLGLFEWSAPDGADPEDLRALAQANPNLGRRLDVAALLAEGRRAKAKGGRKLSGFRTEAMCIRVRADDPAVDPKGWADCREVGTLDEVRGRVALCLDVAPDAQHATLCAAAMLADGRIRIEVVTAWVGIGCTDVVRKQLPAIVRRIRPAVVGWLPAGPAAELAPDLADRRAAGRPGWPPPGVTVAEIRADAPAACMGLAGLVAAGGVVHSGDPLLDAHIGAAERLVNGDTWTFSRRGRGHVDAAYAAAGAVILARTLPAPVGKPRVIRAVARDPAAG